MDEEEGNVILHSTERECGGGRMEDGTGGKAGEDAVHDVWGLPGSAFLESNVASPMVDKLVVDAGDEGAGDDE